jgi:hypothetical protein
VSELIDPISESWDMPLVQQSFAPDDARIILSIPIVEQSEDYLAWHLDKKGVFSVKSAYKLHVDLMQRENRPNSDPHPEQLIWKRLWKMNCPPKVLHFLWRFCHNSHPLYMNIERRGVDLNTRCTVCCRNFEDGSHLFIQCKEVKKMWRALKLEDVRLRLCECANPLQVMEYLQSIPNDMCMKGVALLWCWWQERNKINHEEQRHSVSDFQFLIQRHVEEWKSICIDKKVTSTVEKKSWLPPPDDMVKINFDGAFSEEAQSGGWGAIGRDAAGEPVFAVAGRVNAASEALQSELLALVNVIPVAENLGIGRVVFSTDCLVLKQAMETNSYDLSRLGPLFLHAKFLLSMSFVQFSFEYVSRL